MATARKKEKIAVKFELSWKGLLAAGLVCFCLFLWMFLFGVWTGQTLLMPSVDKSGGIKDFAARYWHQNEDIISKVGSAVEKKQKPGQVLKAKKVKEVPTVISLQVAAFKDDAKARSIVLRWRARGYESFYLAPEEPNGSFYRVFIGVFNKMADAKKMKANLEVSEKNKYFITLIPVTEKRFP